MSLCCCEFPICRTNLQSIPEGVGVIGDEIIPYMPPIPYQGTGYHRYIFVLYRQDRGKIDLNQWRKGNPSGWYV